MIQKLQPYTNFNGMNKLLPKARTAVLSAVAAVGLGAMTSCSSCSNDNTVINKKYESYNIPKGVAPEYYNEYIETQKDSAKTVEMLKYLKHKITAEKYEKQDYIENSINPSLANSKTTLTQVLKIKHDMLLEKQKERNNRLDELKDTKFDNIVSDIESMAWKILIGILVFAGIINKLE